ncbi:MULTISPECIES: ornithine carbamoyltransferase [Curvivirga]|uniref:ornithine carbamoyltransferase n=1 Tax=Curvivirga TaxID=2856846 RepID=UPI0012BB5CBD|nr:ornithine carbamoyltransferase [Curvivirga aplysinae]MTI11223.1 ornithine carbamoyltransferase [Curvivirga aplysinae]
MTNSPKHFLDLDHFQETELRSMLDAGNAFRKGNARGTEKPLEGKVLACIFEKPSTRTRLSFDVGMKQLGGEVVVITPSESQLGHGESIADTARVLSRYVDAIMIRTTTEDKLLELAEYATVPVINGLTDRTHPCQLMADVMTYEQHRGSIKGKTITWSGDGNNMATSFIHAAVRFDFTLRLATPEELPVPQDVIDWAKAEGGNIEVYHSPEPAAEGADCIVTDTWVSMGDKDAPVRHNLLKSFQVDERLMARAKSDAIFMHCLPAYRGNEVTAEVIDGPQSVIWDEAENRLHAQKGVLAYCLDAL